MPFLTHFCILLAVVALHGGTVAETQTARPFNQPNRTLAVLVAPSIWDNVFQEDFLSIINFQIEFARILHEHENVIFVADKHTLPYLDGRIPEVHGRIPLDAIIESNLYDINVHDYAPLGLRTMVKNKNYAEIKDKQVDDSFNKFMLEDRIRVEKRETELALSGQDVVENGIDRAVISSHVAHLNELRLPDWAIMIKLFNTFRKVAIVEKPAEHSDRRLDDLMTFIDDDVLAVSSMNEESREMLGKAVERKFRGGMMIVDLPISGLQRIGSCGFYTASLSTDKHLYIPVYGNDPINWKHGFSSMDDRMALNIITANTLKKVVPVSVPLSFCKRGLSLRSIVWTVRGQVADHLIGLPKLRFAL